MAGAVYGEDPITLGSLGNWLVLLPDENPANPPPRINRGQVQTALSAFLCSRAETGGTRTEEPD
jgi:hypothetical protein